MTCKYNLQFSIELLLTIQLERLTVSLSSCIALTNIEQDRIEWNL